MKRRNKEQGQKIILGILFLAIATLIFVTYLNYRESGKKASFLANEKQMIIKDLKQMQENFNELSEAKGAIVEEIKNNRNRIGVLLDSIALMEVDYEVLQRYRDELTILRNENTRYRKIIDSIQYKNLLLEREIDSSKLRIRALNYYSETLKDSNNILTSDKDSLLKENTKLTDKLSSGSLLTIYKLRGSAFKFRANGKVIETNRANKTERIRACFTVLPNRLLKGVGQTIYLQIIDPKNNVLGAKKTVHFGDNVLTYSKELSINIQDIPVDICDYVISDGGRAHPGLYVINIFFGEKKLSSATFELK